MDFNQKIIDRVIKALSYDQLKEFNQLLDDKNISDVEIKNFLAKSGIDIKALIEE